VCEAISDSKDHNVSQQTRTRRPDERPPTRAEKRKAWKEAAARAAAARKRRRVIGGTLGSLVVVALLVTLVVVVVSGGDDDNGATGSGTGSQAGPTAQGFPPVPEGADPALRTKPAVGKGDGAALTKLAVTTLIKGTGAGVIAGQQVTVNYVGVSYKTGEEFDSSWKRQQTFDFQVGAGRVIKGWDEGLVGVTVGSRVQLDIPADLAYGDNAASGPSGPLRFVVDVLAVTSGPV
jgi:peptidylprolyl isomerase